MSQEINCSTPGCTEKPFIALCMEHYNETLEKNEELAEILGKKEIKEDQIMEPLA